MEKAFVAQRIAKQLWKTEATIDAAIVDAAALLTDVIQGRKDVNLSPIFADEVNVKLMAAMQALAEARTAMVAVHEEMSEAKLRLGIRTKMDIQQKGPTLSATTDLREVG